MLPVALDVCAEAVVLPQEERLRLAPSLPGRVGGFLVALDRTGSRLA
jgi:hypothetical protein